MHLGSVHRVQASLQHHYALSTLFSRRACLLFATDKCASVCMCMGGYGYIV